MEGKCECNWGMGIISVILMSVALFLLVQGFAIQLDSAGAGRLAYVVLVWYLVGFILMIGAKMAKHKTMGSCPMHCGPKMGMMMKSMPSTNAMSVKKKRR